MPRDLSKEQRTTRRYNEDEKAAAVRMARTLRAELVWRERSDDPFCGAEHGRGRHLPRAPVRNPLICQRTVGWPIN